MPFSSPMTPSFQLSTTTAIDIALVDAASTGAGAGSDADGAAGAGVAAGAVETDGAVVAGRTAGALGSCATRPPKTARPVDGFTGAGAI